MKIENLSAESDAQLHLISIYKYNIYIGILFSNNISPVFFFFCSVYLIILVFFIHKANHSP